MHTFNVDEMHKRSVWTYFYNQPSNVNLMMMISKALHIQIKSEVCWSVLKLHVSFRCKSQKTERETEKQLSETQTRKKPRIPNSWTHLKHQSNQNENHQTKHNVRVILNEKLLAEERITLVSPAKSHFTSSRFSAGLFFPPNLKLPRITPNFSERTAHARFSHEPNLARMRSKKLGNERKCRKSYFFCFFINDLVFQT